MTEVRATSGKAIYNVFYEHGEVRAEFSKEYISLWPGWLGQERLHLLDEVSDAEWLRFNPMLLATFEAFRMGVVDHGAENVEFPARLEPLLSDRLESQQKDASQFSHFVIPALDCVIAEDWDYT